jgi:hypothetical protein
MIEGYLDLNLAIMLQLYDIESLEVFGVASVGLCVLAIGFYCIIVIVTVKKVILVSPEKLETEEHQKRYGTLY